MRLVLPDCSLELTTDRGVFSADRVDIGTKLLLLETPPPEQGQTVVDLGCGGTGPGVDGAWLLLAVRLMTKASDIGAFFAGTAFGRHKLAPRISPGKTVEGVRTTMHMLTARYPHDDGMLKYVNDAMRRAKLAKAGGREGVPSR